MKILLLSTSSIALVFLLLLQTLLCQTVVEAANQNDLSQHENEEQYPRRRLRGLGALSRSLAATVAAASSSSSASSVVAGEETAATTNVAASSSGVVVATTPVAAAPSSSSVPVVGRGANLSVLANTNQLNKIPDIYETSVANVSDAFYQPLSKSTDTPVLWKLAKTGTAITVQPFLTDCLNLVVANEVGKHLLSGQLHQTGAVDQSLQISTEVLEVVTLSNERRYLNVDPTTVEGLSAPTIQKLPHSGLADVIISPLLTGVLQLFDSEHKARLFTVMRHPVERCVSIFYSKQKAELENPVQPAVFATMTLEEYSTSTHVPANAMTRSLLNKPSENLTAQDVYVAQQILRTKFLIGLSDKMEESLKRFQTYFGWDAMDHYRLGVLHKFDECQAQYLSSDHIAQHQGNHAPISQESPEWSQLIKLNWADVALYDYAVTLFDGQAKYFEQAAALAQAQAATQTQPQAQVPAQPLAQAPAATATPISGTTDETSSTEEEEDVNFASEAILAFEEGDDPNV